MSPTIPADLDAIRSLFPITQRTAYLYNGNIAPCATPVRVAMEHYLGTWTLGGDAAWEEGFGAFEQAKTLFARLVGGNSDSLCSVPNTSTGVNLAARMIAPAPGSNVVVDELSHMSNVYPWLQLRESGVEVRMARARDGRVPIDELARLVDARTAAIDLCHVSMANGFRFDLAELCSLARSVDAALVIDAAQSAGAIPIDLAATPVDFLVAPMFKWMLGPLGTGFLHVRSDWIERAQPPMIGWLAVTDPEVNDLRDIRLHRSAMRFEGGSLNLVGFVGARAGLQLLHDVGLQWAYSRIAELAERVYRGLDGLAPLGVRLWTPPDPAERAGIVAFDVPRRPRLHRHLESRGIHVGHWLEHIRVDPCFYNSEEEVDRFLAETEAFLRS
jgi:selenocysteine lyase/cysteine desulfurase